MTFEEDFKKQFPGIANQGWQILLQVVSYDRMLSTDDKKMIIKHCLDKQRVKDTIEHSPETLTSSQTVPRFEMRKMANYLLKELGLE